MYEYPALLTDGGDYFTVSFKTSEYVIREMNTSRVTIPGKWSFVSGRSSLADFDVDFRAISTWISIQISM